MGGKRLANLWGFAAKHLLVNWQYSLAMLLPLALALAVMSAMTFIRDGLRDDARLSTAFLPDITVQMLSSGRSTHVQAGVSERIARLEHVARVVPRIWGILPIHTDGQDNAYTLLGIDPARMPIPPAIRFAIKSGRFLLRAEDRGCLVLGDTVARSLHAKVGDRLTIRTPAEEKYDFRVIGIFTTAVQIYAADMLLTHLEDARNFFGYAQGEAADLCVYLHGTEHTDVAASAIARALPACRVLTRDTLARVLEQS